MRKISFEKGTLAGDIVRDIAYIVGGIVTLVPLAAAALYATTRGVDALARPDAEKRAAKTASELAIKSYTDDGYTFESGTVGDVSSDGFNGTYFFSRNDSTLRVSTAFEAAASGIAYIPATSAISLVGVKPKQ